MKLYDVINLINKSTYCLWVGAGIGKYISKKSKTKVPSWEEFVEKIELESKFDFEKHSFSLPERLEIVKNRIRAYKLNEHIRDYILKPIAYSVVEQTENQVSGVPDFAKALSNLGSRANPIVNFNVETISSSVLAIGGGPHQIKYYGIINIPEKYYSSKGAEPPSEDVNGSRPRYKRHILHPHGAIDGYGVSVLSKSEYEKHQNSMAYQMAIHGAFEDDLIIIGMSLNDEYLKLLISKYRNEIRRIIWIEDSAVLNQEIRNWVFLNNIDLVEIRTWDDFWKKLEYDSMSNDEAELLSSWSHVVSTCISEINDASEFERRLKMFASLANTKRILIEEKAKALDYGIRFSESCDSPRQFSEEDECRVLKKILRQIHELIQRRSQKDV